MFLKFNYLFKLFTFLFFFLSDILFRIKIGLIVHFNLFKIETEIDV